VSPTELVIERKDESGKWVRCAACADTDKTIVNNVVSPMKRAVRKRFPDYADRPAAFTPRGGLGLTLGNATAEFRNVTIQPRPSP
jgi:hypothetical protein